MTFLLNLINSFCQKRLLHHGYQCLTLGVYGLFNYPLAYFYKAYVLNLPETESLFIRLFSTFLSIILLLKNYWPERLKKWLPLYWYFTIFYTLPYLVTYLLLKNHMTLGWLMNSTVAMVIFMLLVDWLMCIILSVLGIVFGLLTYVILGGAFNFTVNPEYGELFVYMMSCIFILGTIFSRNKEIYNNYLLKAKDSLNEHLEQKVQERTENLELAKNNLIKVNMVLDETNYQLEMKTSELEETNLRLENMVYERTLYLEEALQVKRNLLANVSHEVRTPLHGILNLAQMMFEGWGEPNKENIRTLYDVSRRLEELVSNILDLSAIEADQMKLSPTEFDVLEMSHETISQARGIAAGLNKTIKYSFKSDKEFASKVYADRRKLKQVLYNILSNAIKYCGDENEITVSVFDMENPQFFAISIEDRGIGIPEGEEEHIFEAFAESSRTKSMAGGKGLGLALTREIMRMHGGKVWAKNNELKKGATFYVVLSKDGSTIHPDYIAGNDESEEGEKPAKPQEEKRKIIVPSSKNISRKTAQVEVVYSKKIGPKKGRIMIIDDEEIVRNTAAIILQSMGYDTVSAASGPAAFEYLEQNPDVSIDLILLDLMMPEMYGITVLEKLKANSSLASIPVVIQSGSSDYNELNRALKTGAVSILAKPYSKTEIEQTIAEVLG